MTVQDKQIVALYFERSESAIKETQKKYGKYCYYISFRILGDSRDAEECVNDTYMKAWEAIPPHKPNALSTFLGKITRNLSIMRYERNNAKKRTNGAADAVLDELRECVSGSSGDISDDIAVRNALDSFLRSLPKETRIVFVQRYWYMYSVREIAKAHASSESKIKMTLKRTREKLRVYLEEEGIAV